SLGSSVSLDGRRLGIMVADQAGFHLQIVDDVDSQPRPPRELYASQGITFGPALSADGTLVVLGSSERSGGKLQFALLALDAATGERVGELWDGPDTSLSAGRFSSVPGDARLLASSNRTGLEQPLIWNARTGERRDFVLGGLQGSVEAWDWSPNAETVLLGNIHEAISRIFLYNLADDTMRPVDLGGTVLGASFIDDNELLVVWSDAASPIQSIGVDAHSGERTRVIFPAPDVPPGVAWRSVSFASSDGQPIQAWLATPPGNGPFATILETHGGPTAVQTEVFSAGAQMWLDHGFAYMSVNYRGSTTFGKPFEERIWGDLGHWEVEDMVAARDWLVREGIADPDAILLTGWSYGGYLTLMGLGKRPELWAGGMAGIAIADWAIQWEDTAPTLRGYQEALLGGTPRENPQQYRRSSPITYADAVQAPVLVIQGRNDTRCPARPMELYEQLLRERGHQIEVEWFDAGHGSHDTEQRIRHAETMLRFAYRVLG
ncbi:MAG TPA: prolyl oligopeptidase family serine peptidase, partial [Roseiflexaceae bacterium]|nr:prolyl oligopeptidase family serine peptidase [Roseiflexaceae bacterium]